MRFITMHKADAGTEAGLPPPPGLIAGIGALLERMTQAGVFESGEGLRASALGVRARYRNGSRELSAGPFTPGNELPALFIVVSVPDREDTLPWADRHAQILGDIEIDIRPICEPCHLGMAPPPPAGTPLRYMLQVKATAQSESREGIAAAHKAALAQLHAEMRRAGVLLGAESMRPSSEGLRAQYRGGLPVRVIDGPFTESKELIAGYCIMNTRDRDQALEWVGHFAACFPGIEVDIRPLEAPAA